MLNVYCLAHSREHIYYAIYMKEAWNWQLHIST